MKRRGFLSGLGAAAWLAFPAYGAEQDKVPRIGYLGRLEPHSDVEDGLRQGLRELGYSEGKEIRIEWRNNLGFEDELRPLAAELVRMEPQVIVTLGTPATRAVLEATKIIPVVFAGVGDPVATGLVANLARPEANATGVSLLSSELGVKRLDLLRQLAPHARRVAYLVALANPANAVQAKAIQKAAQSLGIRLDTYNVRTVREVESTLRAIPWKSTDGILVGGDGIFRASGAKISEAVRAARVPAVFPFPDSHQHRVLMSYGPDVREVGRRSAYYVDKILKGAKPSDLPVEQVSQVELIIDLRVARELGIKVSEELLFRANRLIR